MCGRALDSLHGIVECGFALTSHQISKALGLRQPGLKMLQISIQIAFHLLGYLMWYYMIGVRLHETPPHAKPQGKLFRR